MRGAAAGASATTAKAGRLLMRRARRAMATRPGPAATSWNDRPLSARPRRDRRWQHRDVRRRQRLVERRRLPSGRRGRAPLHPRVSPGSASRDHRDHGLPGRRAVRVPSSVTRPPVLGDIAKAMVAGPHGHARQPAGRCEDSPASAVHQRKQFKHTGGWGCWARCRPAVRPLVLQTATSDDVLSEDKLVPRFSMAVPYRGPLTRSPPLVGGALRDGYVGAPASPICTTAVSHPITARASRRATRTTSR